MKRTKQVDKHISNIEQMIGDFGEMKDALESTFDSKSEKWQESEKGMEVQDSITMLEDIFNGLEAVLQDLEDAFNESDN